jgi:cysteine synthase A
MAREYLNITQTVGDTPLVKLNRLGSPDVTILAKMESFNPCGSVKDRIALSMVDAAEKAGRLKPGSTLIEPTSGNTGIGLAFVCAARGYKLILAMPESMSVERRKLLKFFGAQIVLTPAALGMRGAVEEAQRLQEATPGSVILQQFSNPANPEMHRHTTAEEIWRDTGGEIDIFVSGVGTGGTLTGCGEVLKQRKPSVRIIAVEPQDSPVLSGGKAGPHKIQGIGAGFVPEVLNRGIIDEIVQVGDDQALHAARQLAVQEGIGAGISSGAALHAAIEVSHRPDSKGKTIVFILCDSGERYISTDLFAET